METNPETPAPSALQEGKYPLVVVDGSNLYRSLETLLSQPPRIDPEKLRRLLTGEVASPKAYTRYYLALPPVSDGDFRSNTILFTRVLRHYDWWVITKDLVVIYTDQSRGTKGNMDVEIGYDIGRLLSNSSRRERISRLVLASGDRDFICLIRKAHEYNLPVTILAGEQSLAREIKEKLTQVNDKLILLEDVVKDILWSKDESKSEDGAHDSEQIALGSDEAVPIQSQSRGSAEVLEQ